MENCTGGKQSSVRQTVWSWEMDRSAKHILMAIGKYKYDRWFNRCKKNISVSYRAYQKARITSDLFEEWLIEISFVNRQLHITWNERET